MSLIKENIYDNIKKSNTQKLIENLNKIPEFSFDKNNYYLIENNKNSTIIFILIKYFKNDLNLMKYILNLSLINHRYSLFLFLENNTNIVNVEYAFIKSIQLKFTRLSMYLITNYYYLLHNNIDNPNKKIINSALFIAFYTNNIKIFNLLIKKLDYNLYQENHFFFRYSLVNNNLFMLYNIMCIYKKNNISLPCNSYKLDFIKFFIH